MKNMILALLSMTAISTLAHADWVKQVTYSEAIFNCKGMSPDLMTAPSVNVSGGNDGEYRLPEGLVSSNGKQVSLLGKPLGTLDTAPTCTVSDAGEAAFSEWVKIDISSQNKLTLAFDPNTSSCVYGIEQGDQIRTNIYTLTLTSTDGKSVSKTWQEEAHYASPIACQSIDD